MRHGVPEREPECLTPARMPLRSCQCELCELCGPALGDCGCVGVERVEERGNYAAHFYLHDRSISSVRLLMTHTGRDPLSVNQIRPSRRI